MNVSRTERKGDIPLTCIVWTSHDHKVLILNDGQFYRLIIQSMADKNIIIWLDRQNIVALKMLNETSHVGYLLSLIEFQKYTVSPPSPTSSLPKPWVTDWVWKCNRYFICDYLLSSRVIFVEDHKTYENIA